MILITGATGFLGAHLLKTLLQQGEKVRALYRNDKSLLNHPILSAEDVSRTEWLKMEINDTEIADALIGVEQVYHCAAMVSFNPKDKKQMMKVNAEGTANLVNHLIDLPNVRLLHVSSVSALEGAGVLDENSFPEDRKLLSNYGKSKYRAELEVWRASQEGLNMVIINPTVILGPGNWNTGTAKLFQMVSKGLKAFSPGSTGFVSVDDVVKAGITLMNSNVRDRRFIINGENLSYKKLFSLIARYLDKPAPSFVPPRVLANLAWRLSGFLDFFGTGDFLSRESVQAAYRVRAYSSARIKDELNLGFTPIQNCVEQTCKVFLEQQK